LRGAAATQQRAQPMKQLDVEYLDLNYLDSVISIDPMISIPSSASHGSRSEVPAVKSVVRHPSRLPPPASLSHCSGPWLALFQLRSIP
jgi:hypothetical protein